VNRLNILLNFIAFSAANGQYDRRVKNWVYSLFVIMGVERGGGKAPQDFEI